MKRLLTALVLATALAASGAAGAAELAGVTMPDQRTLAGERLVLNGMGLRKKLVIKVYVGGLYLAAPASDASAILASDTAKAIVMHFVRDVDAAKLVGAFREGFAKNAPDQARAAGAAVERFLELVPDVEKDTELIYVWAPGRGLVVLENGVERGVVDDRALSDAVFASYIGPEPPSRAFKEGLLGH